MIRKALILQRPFFRRNTGKCLVIAEHDQENLKEATYAAISAASQLGSTTVLVTGKNCLKICKKASMLKNVKKVLSADYSDFKFGMPEVVAPFISQFSNEFSHIILGDSNFGKNILPRAAALSSCAPITDVIQINDEKTFIRPMYAGNVLATIQSQDKCKFLTVRLTSFPLVGTQSECPIESVSCSPSLKKKSNHLSFELSKNKGPALTSATTIISGGRGLGSSKNFKMLYDLSKKLPNCAVGASRAAVDSGFAPNDLQIGQTGKIVAPQLYIAIGLSGAIQHLAGMKDSKVIVAINKDSEAPIFQVADYGIIGDLFEKIPELLEKLV